jgi:hypothetical protein
MEKNNRERAKREKHQEKQARRLERKSQRRSGDDEGAPDESLQS